MNVGHGFIEDEMQRFEAEIRQQQQQQQPQPFMGNRMFLPPQMRGMAPHGGHPMMGHHPMGLIPPQMRFPMGRPSLPTQSVIAAPPKPSAAVISAPAQTTTSKRPADDEDDDILATLQKYEAEVKGSNSSPAKGKAPIKPAQVTMTTTTQRKASAPAASAVASKLPTQTSSSLASSSSYPTGVKPPPSATMGEESVKKAKKQKRIVRTGGGQIWEDETLKDWDPSDFRVFCGDLGNDVTDEVLVRTFSRYPSFQRAKVIRDKKTNKTKGFGFVSFKDPSDFTRAIRELNGKYVGSRPIKLRKSNWKDRNIEVVRTKQKMKQQMGYKW